MMTWMRSLIKLFADTVLILIIRTPLNPYQTCPKTSLISHLLLRPKATEWVTNRVQIEKMPRSVVYD